MRFEFDPAKSERNHEKHGIDFVEAQEIWRDKDAVELDARSEDEAREALIGRIGEVNWLAIITRRGERIRIISIRRARGNERKIYHGNRV